MSDRQSIADTVLRIELVLRRSHLWSSQPPSPAAMAEESLPALEDEAERLLPLLREFDELIKS